MVGGGTITAVLFIIDLSISSEVEGASGVRWIPCNVTMPSSPMLMDYYTNPARVDATESTTASTSCNLTSSAHEKSNDSSS